MCLNGQAPDYLQVFEHSRDQNGRNTVPAMVKNSVKIHRYGSFGSNSFACVGTKTAYQMMFYVKKWKEDSWINVLSILIKNVLFV